VTSPSGGFYSAEDADSEGEEGKFYLWTYDEIKRTLDSEEAELFIKLFNINREGNFSEEGTGLKTGRNIPHLNQRLDEIAAKLNISLHEMQERLEPIKQKLLNYREQRVHPHKDDKILTDWNGLMIAALAVGGRVLDEPKFTDAAVNALDFILKNMHTLDGRLLHRYREDEAALPAHLNDYVFMIYGMLELYETTFEADYLQKALEFNQILLKHFWDSENGGFYFTADDGEELLVRQKEIYDGAIPSGNSIAMLNLLRLGRIAANADLEDKASEIARAFAAEIQQMPSAYTQLMIAIDFSVGPSHELVITGNPEGDDTKTMLRTIRQEYIPNKIVLFLSSEFDNTDIKSIVPYTEYMLPIDGKATAYVCTDYRCKAPTTDISTMLSFLNSV
jgi:uncharacterized protein YyaL (SSP411 family)